MSVQSGDYSLGLRASYIDIGMGSARRLVYGYPGTNQDLGLFLVDSKNTITGKLFAITLMQELEHKSEYDL